MSVNPLTSAVIFDQEGSAWLRDELMPCPLPLMTDYEVQFNGWCYFQLLDVDLHRPETLAYVKQLSQRLPLLFYIRRGDYLGCEDDDGEFYECKFDGWGYRVFHQGEEVATALFDFQWPTWGSALEEKLQALARNANIEALSLFKFIPKYTRQAVADLLDPQSLFARLDEGDELCDIAIEFEELLMLNSAFVDR